MSCASIFTVAEPEVFVTLIPSATSRGTDGLSVPIPRETPVPTKNSDPSKVKFESSSRAPEVPAMTTRLLVKSLTVAEERTVSPPEMLAPASPSIAPLIVVIPAILTLEENIALLEKVVSPALVSAISDLKN